MFYHKIFPFYCLLSALSLTGCAINGVSPNEGYTLPLSEQEARAEMDSQRVPHWLKDRIASLYKPDPEERAWAAYRLAKMGTGAAPAVPHLVRLLADDTPVLLSRYLGGGYNSSSDTTPAEEAAVALGKIGDASSEALIAATGHSKANTRRLAAKALGQIGGVNSIPYLISLLDDESRQVRAAAGIALGSYRHPRAAQAIMDAMSTASTSARRDMVYALAQIRDLIVVPFLIKRFEQEEPDVRVAIVHALGKLRDARAIEVLLHSLTDRDPVIRSNSVYALGNYYTPEVVEGIIQVLADESPEVAEAAGEALVQLSGKDFGTDEKKWRNWWETQKQAMGAKKNSR